MSWTSVFAFVRNTVTNLFNEILFLVYNLVYDLNALFFNISAFIFLHTPAIAMLAAVTLISYEIYIMAPAITAMALFTTLLTAIPILLITVPTIGFSTYYMGEYYEDKCLPQAGRTQAGLSENRFTKILVMFFVLAAFVLVIAPPIVSLISPTITSVLTNSIFVLSAITDGLFAVGTFLLGAANSAAQAGDGDGAILILAIAAIPCVMGGVTYLLAATISHFGPANIALCLASLIAIAPVMYGILRSYDRAENIATANATCDIKCHLMLQLSMLLRAALTAAISSATFNLAGPTLITLIAPYSAYILVAAGAIPLTITLYTSYRHNKLSSLCAAAAYTLLTCYLISHHSIAFMLAPRVLSIILALGVGVVGQAVLSHATAFLAGRIIDKVFKPGSAITSLRLKYREFISNMKLPKATPIIPTVATRDIMGHPAPEAIVETVPRASVCKSA